MPSDTTTKMSILMRVKFIDSTIKDFPNQVTDDDKYTSLSLIYTSILELYEVLYMFKKKEITIEPIVLTALYKKLKPIHKRCNTALRMTIINCKKQNSGGNCNKTGLKILYNSIMATFDVIVKDLHKFSKSSEKYISENALYNSLNDISSDIIEREANSDIKKRMRSKKNKRRASARDATHSKYSAIASENTTRDKREAMRAKYSAVESENTTRRGEKAAMRAKYSAIESENTTRRGEKAAMRAKYSAIEAENTDRRRSSMSTSSQRTLKIKSTSPRRTAKSSPRRSRSSH
jgi:hypothetical protein